MFKKKKSSNEKKPLIPYTHKVQLVTQIDFEGMDFKIFNPKIPYIDLHRRGVQYHKHIHFKAIACCLKILNPNLSISKLQYYMDIIEQDHFRYPVGSRFKEDTCKWVYKLADKGKLENPGRYRKIIFNPNSNLNNEEKRVIIGKYSKKRKTYTDENIYYAIEELLEEGEDITYESIGLFMGCSKRTIIRNASKEVKEIIRENKLIHKRDLEELK